MQEGARPCPLCGHERPASKVDEESQQRADIFQLRQRLESLEREQPPEGLQAQAQAELQERIDRGLDSLSGGYGSDGWSDE